MRIRAKSFGGDGQSGSKPRRSLLIWTPDRQPSLTPEHVRQALNLVLVGMACGLTLAVPMAFAMQATFVAKVTATDPMVFLPTISVLLAVGMLAAAIPALRASRIDPIATLRQE